MAPGAEGVSFGALAGASDGEGVACGVCAPAETARPSQRLSAHIEGRIGCAPCLARLSKPSTLKFLYADFHNDNIKPRHVKTPIVAMSPRRETRVGLCGGMAVGNESEMKLGFWVLASVLASLALPAAAARSAEHLPGETFRDCEACDEMVVVPAGAFLMGSTAKPSQSPPHKVMIPHDFAIARREVSSADWGRCVAASACSYAPPGLSAAGERAITNVSWSDAKEYIAWISKLTGKTYRLPTEAEWEYSARAGTATAYWWGKEAGAGHANCADCGAKSASVMAVGSFRPNGFGLYDTAGNAAEWVEDCWNPSFAGAPATGAAWTTGDCSLRVLRGGSFLDKATAVASAARFRYDYDVRYEANGFRIARDFK